MSEAQKQGEKPVSDLSYFIDTIDELLRGSGAVSRVYDAPAPAPVAGNIGAQTLKWTFQWWTKQIVVKPHDVASAAAMRIDSLHGIQPSFEGFVYGSSSRSAQFFEPSGHHLRGTGHFNRSSFEDLHKYLRTPALALHEGHDAWTIMVALIEAASIAPVPGLMRICMGSSEPPHAPRGFHANPSKVSKIQEAPEYVRYREGHPDRPVARTLIWLDGEEYAYEDWRPLNVVAADFVRSRK